jgi:hypothetical protein
MLQYLFGPMFEATVDPKSHPEMAKFMTQVIQTIFISDVFNQFDQNGFACISLTQQIDIW